MTDFPTAVAPEAGWHVPAQVLAAYAAEDVPEADAWSAEAHLARCARCRTDLAALVDASPLHRGLLSARSAVMAQVGGRVGGNVAARGPVAAALAGVTDPVTAGASGSPAPWVRPALVLRGPWMAAVAVAVLVAAAAELAGTLWHGPLPSPPPVLLLGPLVPLAGVGLCYRATDRGWAEAALATPSAGLRLVLWRTLAVLAIAIPITVLAALVGGQAGPMLWLLPALGLATASLALGSRIELGRATAVVAAAWTLAVVVPSLAARSLPAPVFSGAAQMIWAAVAVGLLAVTALRRASFARLPTWRPAAGRDADR